MTLEQIPPPTPYGIIAASQEAVAGRIDTTGSGSIVVGSGFTINRTGTGAVTVTFTKAFSSTPIVVVSGRNITGNWSTTQQSGDPTTTSFNVQVMNQSFAAADGIFNFIAFVPSTSQTRQPRDYGLVTTLPTSPVPVTGDFCTFTNSLTSPTYNWRLMYNSSDSATQKWECIGGTPMAAYSNATVTTTSATFVAPTGGQLTLTLPLAGDYDIWGTAQLLGSASNVASVWSYAVGALAASDDWAAEVSENFTSAPNRTAPAPQYRHTGRSANDSVAEQVRCGGSGTASALRRSLRVMPVRVG